MSLPRHPARCPTATHALRCPASPLRLLCAGALAMLSPLTTTQAQTQIVKPPVAQYWMDVSTASMAGMDDMPAMPTGASGLGGLGGLAGVFGGGAAGGQVPFGQTKGLMPGRWLDLAVQTQRKPAGTQATQAIPPGMDMGPQLVLLPPPPPPPTQRMPTTRGRDEPEREEVPEQPKGRILLYWGCSETVRPGQPKVLDFSKASFQDYGQFMAGRSVRERGATAEPGHAIWPNPPHGRRVPAQASLVGAHTVAGDGIPESLKFSIGQAQDFMPKLGLSAQGGGEATTWLTWSALPTARAYFFNAMGSGNNDMVIWSSSELPEPGWGLLNYASNANVDKWLAEKVLLPASQTRCAVPAGIFAKTDGGMVQGIGYGYELNLVHPPRPADPKQPWEQEWAARIRVKSVAMLPLEASAQGAPSGRSNRRGASGAVPASVQAPEAEVETPASAPMPTDSPATPPAEPSAPAPRPSGLPSLPGLGNVLKGILGR